MAKNNGLNNNPDEESTDDAQASYTDDLSFAGGPQATPPAAAPQEQDQTEDAPAWTPTPKPADDDNAAEEDLSEVIDKTWVPPVAPAGIDETDDHPPTDRNVDDTWVPDHKPSAAEQPTTEAEPEDPNKTWVPSSTPTHSGIEQPLANPEPDDPNKTWVPSSTPTHSGIEQPIANPEPDDPNKTWVPSSTPTHSGLEQPIANPEPDDPNKTWVPSSTPTHSGIEQPTPPPEFGDPTKTQVMGNTPTHQDFSADNKNDAASDTGMNTVVMGGPGAGDATLPGTLAGETETDRTQIFSRTVAMQGMSSEEYSEWQKDVAENDGSATIVTHPNREQDADSTIPGTVAGTGAGSGAGTQIWATQTGGGLDANLTIRSRPVAGDGQFESEVTDDQPDYQIVEKLAEGGMGAIYIATQTSLNRELAIKTLKPLRDHEKRTYTSQGRMSQVVKQRREMFLSEALVTANLVHPHIIPIHDLCQTVDGSPFYSMKRVIGTPWNELIVEMTEENNLEVLDKVCDAVAYAHHNGVVNRDLKPENIMLGEFGEVLVLDWGLAIPSTTNTKGEFASASASFGAGTPAYMSPELWAGPPEAIGTWSDVYLMGAILYEIVTGKPPHKFPEPDSKTGNSGLWKLIDSVVRKNEIRETDCKGELINIAMKAMHTDCKKRHQSVLEFQIAIKCFQKHEESRRLADRAAETLGMVALRDKSQPGERRDPSKPDRRQGYQSYQTAAALYEESFNAWPENDEAREGLRHTRLRYAELAHAKGDFDLGLQVAAQEEGVEFSQLTKKLTRARKLRNGLKYGTIAAAAIIVMVGAISFVQAIQIAKQKDEIVALYGDKEQLETDLKVGQKKVDEADGKVAAAEAKVEAADNLLIAATAKVAEAETDLADANAEVQMVKAEVKLATTEAAAAKSKAAVAAKEAMEADAKAVVAAAAATKAMAEAAAANVEIATAEKKIAAAKVEVAKLDVARVRAGVDLRNADIANLIRNSDYAAALRQVENMLTALDKDPELSKLPPAERQRRTLELNARQQQLLKRTRSTDAPVQTQTISPSGNTVVWGDSAGNLSVWGTNADSGDFPAEPRASLPLNAMVSTVRISSDEKLIVAAEKNILHLWTPADEQHHTIDGHAADITTVQLADDFLLTADVSGSIRCWDLTTRKERWSIRSSAGIRDLTILPDSGMFLYAGSRGGESADVLAYALPPAATPNARPQRLGQLRLPRDRNVPPQRIAVSPDEQLLLIGNSRNGDLMILPRRSATEFSGRDQFPFVHAADMPPGDTSQWVPSRHQRPINDITFSQDGRRVVTASDDRSIGVWEVLPNDQLQFIERLEGHGARVNAAGFLDSAGRKVLSASADRFCRFWDVDNYDRDRQLIESEFNLSASSTFDRAPAKSKYLFTRHTSPSQQQQVPTPDYVIVNGDHEMQRGPVRSVVLSDDGQRMVTGAADGTAVIWDTQSGQPVTGISTRSKYQPETGSFEEGHDFNVARLRFLPPDGNILLTTGFDGNLCLWNADLKKSGAGTQELRIPGLGLVNAVTASDDGKLIATSVASSASNNTGSATIWNTADLLSDAAQTPVTTLTGFHSAEVSAVSISPDGTKVATGARDGRVAMWTVSTGKLISGSRIHVKNTIVSHLEWLNNDQLLSAGFDGRLMILEAGSSSLDVVSKLAHDKIPIERVAFASGRKRFLTVSVRTDKATKKTAYEMELWTVGQTDPTRQIKAATVKGRAASRIAAVHWSPTGDRVAAAVDGNLQVFDSRTWKVKTVLEAPGLGVSDAVFAPRTTPAGGDVIATFDGTAAHLWNLDDRSHVADFRPLFAVQATALSEHPDHPLLLTGDRAIRVFHADSSSPDFGQNLSKISDPHRGVITSLQFSPTADPQTFISGGADGSAALWTWHSDTQEAKLTTWLAKDGAAIVSADWSPDGRLILLARKDGHVRVIKASDTKQVVADFVVAEESSVKLSTATFSCDGQFFAVAGQIVLSGESRGWVYQLQADQKPDLHCTIQGHEAGGIRCLSFLPDSPYLTTGGTDGAGLIWNWQPERADEGLVKAYEVYQLLVDGQSNAHAAPLNSLTVSTAGSIATASDDGTAIVWRNPFAKQ